MKNNNKKKDYFYSVSKKTKIEKFKMFKYRNVVHILFVTNMTDFNRVIFFKHTQI